MAKKAANMKLIDNNFTTRTKFEWIGSRLFFFLGRDKRAMKELEEKEKFK